MIAALWLPLNLAAIILGCILSMLLSVFNALGPISIPTPPTVALTNFFHADTSIASIVIFDIFGVSVSMFLYTDYVYLMFYYRCSQLW